MHTLAQVFSPSTFKKVVWEGDKTPFLGKIKKYSRIINGFQPGTNREALKELYNFLKENYRSEYLYKNRLINKLIEEKKLANTTILNEFKVGKSIADTIFVNGEPILYEIKTELDKPDKLLGQIADYQKAFAKIYVITHESVYYKYYQTIKHLPVGLKYLSHDGDFVTLKEAENFDANLNHIVLFKLLRKEEFSSIIADRFKVVPSVPNTLFFRACLELAKQIPIAEFYKDVYGQLKKRGSQELGYIRSDETPKELKYICYTLNFNAMEYQYLYSFLIQPYKL